VLDAAEAQVGAAVRTMALDEADLAVLVAEQHQVLAQDAHRHRRRARRQIGADADRQPVMPHHLAARRARAGAGEELVLFAGGHRGWILTSAGRTFSALGAKAKPSTKPLIPAQAGILSRLHCT